MKTIFNLDNRFFQFMGKAADMMILNLLFILTSLPVITIGVSLTAIYTVSLKQASGTSSYPAKEYLLAWKNNFRQGLILWCFALPVLFFIFLNLNLKVTSTSGLIMRFCIILSLVLVVMILLYAFPLLAKFENSIGHIIVNAFLMSLRHFLTTCMLFATVAFFVFITFAYPAMIELTSMLWFLLFFAVIARVQAQFLNQIFARYIADAN